MGLKLLPSQFIHQKKAYALQNKKMHVNKLLSVNLAVSRWDLLHDSLSVFSSRKVARRARSARRATFTLSYTPQRAISLIIHELQRQKDAEFFTFFHFSWHLEAGIATILLRISWGTIPLKISKRENQGKLPKNASEGTYLVSLNSNRDWGKWAC